MNPVLRVSGGTSGSGLASAFGFIFNLSDSIDLRALYGSVNANLPSTAPDILPSVSGTPLGSGLFGGSSVAAAQLTIKPSKSIDIGLNYANSYHEINILGTGLTSGDIGALASVPLGIPVKLNSFGGTVNFRFTDNIALSGYGAAIFVDDSSGRVDASTTFTSWMVGLHFKDLVSKGNTAGLIFGQPLHRTEADGAATRSLAGVDRATPYHLEGYFKFKVSDNISITPGAFVLFNPEGDSRNDTTTVGVLRTTFTF
jgi:Carbohydrate-selective porin, OprB family